MSMCCTVLFRVDVVGEAKPLPDSIKQKSVKHYIPDEASIWRSNKVNRWHGHLPPYRRVSCAYEEKAEERDVVVNVCRLLRKQRAHLDGTEMQLICFWAFD